jgi:hypothetical protein
LLNVFAAVFVAVRWGEDLAEYRDAALLASLALAGGALALFFLSGPLETQLVAHYLGLGN